MGAEAIDPVATEADSGGSVLAEVFGLEGFEVLAAADAGGELEIMIETPAKPVGCPGCGAVRPRRTVARRGWPICRWRAGRWCCAGSNASGAARTRDVRPRPGPRLCRAPAAGGAHRTGRGRRGRRRRPRRHRGRAGPRTRGGLADGQPAGAGPRYPGHRGPGPARGRQRDRGRRTRLAARQRGAPDRVRHRHRRPDPRSPGAAARPGRGPLRGGAARLAR